MKNFGYILLITLSSCATEESFSVVTISTTTDGDTTVFHTEIQLTSTSFSDESTISIISSESTISLTSNESINSTTEPTEQAICGDGLITYPEECDDLSLTNCNNCYYDRIVFISSKYWKFQYLEEYKGLDGADLLCQQLANEQSFSNAHNFHAWLSSSTENARDRVKLCEDCRYLLINSEEKNRFVAYGSEFLKFNSQLQNAISRDEFGIYTDDWVSTGSYASGVKTSHNCNDWTIPENDVLQTLGDSIKSDYQWTFSGNSNFNPFNCYHSARIYCFESK